MPESLFDNDPDSLHMAYDDDSAGILSYRISASFPLPQGEIEYIRVKLDSSALLCDEGGNCAGSVSVQCDSDGGFVQVYSNSGFNIYDSNVGFAGEDVSIELPDSCKSLAEQESLANIDAVLNVDDVTAYYALTDLSLEYEASTEVPCTADWKPTIWTKCCKDTFTQSRSFVDANACGLSAPQDETRGCGYSTYSYGDSTDFNQVEDPTRVENAVIETRAGKIEWIGLLNIVGADINENTVVRRDLIAVNVYELDKSFNTSAWITIKSLDGGCEKFQLWYAKTLYTDDKQHIKANAYPRDFSWFDSRRKLKFEKMADQKNIGKDCIDPNICEEISCNGRTLKLLAHHFSEFTLGEEPPMESPARGNNLLYTLIGVVLTGILATFAYVRFKK
jgi:hypothetical protein